MGLKKVLVLAECAVFVLKPTVSSTVVFETTFFPEGATPPTPDRWDGGRLGDKIPSGLIPTST